MAKNKRHRRRPKQKIYALDEYTLRDVILERLEKLGASKYDLAHFGGVKAVPSTIFRFLNAEGNTNSDSVEQMLQACGMALVVVDNDPGWLIGEGS